MLRRSCLTGLLIALAALALGADKCGNGKPKPLAVELKQTDLPPKVFSIAGEVEAFRAVGKNGEKQKAALPLQALRARVGKFDSVRVYEFNGKGKLLSRNSLKVGADTSAVIQATVGNLYLVYAELGDRYANTYRVMCRLGGFVGRGELPRICTQILCGNQPFRASDLTRQFPELRGGRGMSDLGDGLIGGFGGGGVGGNVCDKCLDFGRGRGFEPVCEFDLLPPGGNVIGGQIVYHHIPFTSDTEPGNAQIFKMNDDGSNPVNLSNNTNVELRPDVNKAAQRIVFEREGAGLQVMDIDGSNVTAVPNTENAGFAKWSHGSPTPFILFIDPAVGGDTASAFNIFPDGSQRLRIPTSHPDERIHNADVMLDGKNIVFARDVDTRPLNANLSDSELFLEYIWEDRPEVRLTDTTNVLERSPVVSHDGTMIAFNALVSTETGPFVIEQQIRVARITAEDGEGDENVWTFTIIQTIRISLPLTFVSGLNFSRDDTRIIFSALTNDVDSSVANRRSEIFSMNLDGSDLRRLTNNTDFDGFPSAVPLRAN